jgi:hypothetical protein
MAAVKYILVVLQLLELALAAKSRVEQHSQLFELMGLKLSRQQRVKKSVCKQELHLL